MSTQLIACAEPGSSIEPPPGAVTIEELCRDPAQMVNRTEADRLVLLLHNGHYDLSRVQRAARKIGIDPLGLQIHEIDANGTEAPTQATLDGLVARAGAFAGSRPEQAKPTLAREMTRRSFLYPPTPEYVAAPMIDIEMCAAGSGCKACVGICPQTAYTWREGKIDYDIDICVPCGLCTTACPTGAISNASVQPSMIRAQVDGIIGASPGPVGIRFVCSRGSMAVEPGTEDVVVPCASMVPATWILASLVAGASRARSVPCMESGCSLGLDSYTTRANRLAKSVLEAVGVDWAEVAGLTAGLGPQAAEAFEPRGAAGLIDTLSQALGRPVTVHDDSAPLGRVEISTSACTLCGQCAKVCPTGALMETYDAENVMISFDPRLCVNCSQCTLTCPEVDRGAIRVHGVLDSEDVSAGPRTLTEAPVATCENCGEAFAPAAMLSRVAQLLGPEFGATLGVVSTRCLDCRGR